MKIKFSDFKLTTVQAPATRPDIDLSKALLEKGWARARRPVRLLGLGVQFGPGRIDQEQLPLPLDG